VTGIFLLSYRCSFYLIAGHNRQARRYLVAPATRARSEMARWFTFDARHNTPRIGRITVARGRDATDIPLVTSFGPYTLKAFRVWTDEVDAGVLEDLMRRRAARASEQALL